jgi:orotate phosphoribosyltransferase
MATAFDRGRLIDLLKRDALRTGTFTLASGKTSHYYVDGRKVTLSAEGAAAVAEGVLDVLDGRPEVEAVGGLTMGADPIVGATLALAGLKGKALRGFLVRKEPKGHGTGQLVEGPLEHGQTVAIVEDVTTTGGSALKAVDAVEAMGGRVGCVITMLDRLEGAAAAFEARELDFYALATVRDLGVEPLPMHPQVDELPEILG